METLLIIVLLGIAIFVIGAFGIKSSKTKEIEDFFVAMSLAGLMCIISASVITLGMLFHKLLDSIF